MSPCLVHDACSTLITAVPTETSKRCRSTDKVRVRVRVRVRARVRVRVRVKVSATVRVRVKVRVRIHTYNLREIAPCGFPDIGIPAMSMYASHAHACQPWPCMPAMP